MRSASSALLDEVLRPMQGHSAPPATSTSHQLVAQPRKRPGFPSENDPLTSRRPPTNVGVSPQLLAQQFAHAHAPTLPSLHKTGLEPQGFFLYRARAAGVVARPQGQCRFPVSQPCSTRASASFLFRTSVPLSLAGCSLFSSFRTAQQYSGNRGEANCR